jgi:hypothetical protein
MKRCCDSRAHSLSKSMGKHPAGRDILPQTHTQNLTCLHHSKRVIEPCTCAASDRHIDIATASARLVPHLKLALGLAGDGAGNPSESLILPDGRAAAPAGWPCLHKQPCLHGRMLRRNLWTSQPKVGKLAPRDGWCVGATYIQVTQPTAPACRPKVPQTATWTEGLQAAIDCECLQSTLRQHVPGRWHSDKGQIGPITHLAARLWPGFGMRVGVSASSPPVSTCTCQTLCF